MAKIFCFSSTGNSLHIVKTMAQSLNAQLISMGTPPISCNDDLIGFVFPVYYWGLPLSVEHYVNNMQITNPNAYVFAILSYGGKVEGAQGAIAQLLESKGVQLQYTQNIKSVENYMLEYQVNNTPQVHQLQDASIQALCQAIHAKKQNSPEEYTNENRTTYAQYPGLDKHSDAHFSVSSACTSCGLCQKICPMGNILLENGKPTFLHQCQHCIACIHICPTQALQWKNLSQGKPRYRNPNISVPELIEFCGLKTHT